MKKIFAILITAVLVFSLAACSGTSGESCSKPESTTKAQASTEKSKTDSTESDNTSSGSKSLVVYFSRTGEQYGVGVIEKGNTAIVAEMIAEQTGADSFEIIPKEDNYPMTYDALTD